MDPILNAVNVCTIKSTNKLRHFRIFPLFILFKEHTVTISIKRSQSQIVKNPNPVEGD